jgi:hypothetical protein
METILYRILYPNPALVRDATNSAVLVVVG